MPTDLPPDYKPQPANDPNRPADPSVPGSTQAYPPEQGEDSRDAPTPAPQPGADVKAPPFAPDDAAAGQPLPAGMPVF